MAIFIFSILFLLLAAAWSKWLEGKHFAQLAQREAAHADILQTATKTIPPSPPVMNTQLVSGATVIASDYFKAWAASIRNIFGGEVKSLQRMADRGRREATCRMLESARAMGATAVYNIRIETSTIAGKRPGSCKGVEVLAFGTAVQQAE